MSVTDLSKGIRESAAALGMPPEWLAAIISYETGGSFDPVAVGPTTKWGQHKGLIQFGEPQAMQYGVDWTDPIGSQLGASGAVVRYFKDRGWKAGMSFMDAYSIVNAGGPGRYSASDARAGGAPGTVADKVAGMQPHFDNASNLLGTDPDAKNYNAKLSAMMLGTSEVGAAQGQVAASAVRDPAATASSTRDQERSAQESAPPRNPYYQAMRVAYVQPDFILARDPRQMGTQQQVYRR